MHQLVEGDGLACDEFEARNRADHLLEAFRLLFLLDERIDFRARGPFLPAQVVSRHELADGNVVVGDQDLFGRNLDRLWRLGWRGNSGDCWRRRLHRAHEEDSSDRGAGRHKKNDQSHRRHEALRRSPQGLKGALS